MNKISKWKKSGQWLNLFIFAVLLVGYSIVTYRLFYHQAWGSEVSYNSDMLPYILEIMGEDSGYSFPYPLYFKFGAILNIFMKEPQMAAAVALMILNSLSLVIAKYYADKAVGSFFGKKRILGYIISTLLVFALFMVSMLYRVDGGYIPGIYSRYRGVYSPNPYHNATYLATRPFAIAAFFIFIEILNSYQKKTNIKDHVFFSVALFLSTIAKPSFTFVLVPTAGIIMLWRLFRSKFSNFKQTVKLGLCFIPTFIVLLYQFFGVFGPVEETESGVGFGLVRAWSYHCDNIPLAIVLAMAFPLTVLCFNFKELKQHNLFRFTWQIMSVSMLETLLLYEKGFRESHGNFFWGYMHGLFFAFMGTAIFLFEKTCAVIGDKQTEKRLLKIGLLLVQWLVFALHLICGVLYFQRLYQGGTFY